jgi:4-amino-4-deoxy-L-arabinose transferase-like glycosyltransferase
MTEPSNPEPARRRSVWLLLAVSAAIYLGSAAHPGVLDDADGCHALAAREILQRHDWTVLHINGVRWLEKPPFHYWLVAIAFRLLGESAFATRLPIALAMIALVLVLYEFGRRFFDERAGFYAGLVMATSAGVFLFTRIMIPEALYALEFTVAFYLFLRAWQGTLPPRVGYWGFAALVGLATLTRAGVGALFPIGVVTLFVAASGAWRRGSEARRRFAAIPFLSSACIALVVALPWHIRASMRTPGFLWFYFVNEQILRALGKRVPADYTAVPLGLWWIAHLLWFFPWVVYAPVGWRALTNTGAATDETGADARRLIALWALVVFLFFSVVSGSRMEYYSFSAWPAVALMLGAGLAAAERERDRWLPRLQVILAGVGAAAAIVLCGFLWASRNVAATPDISALLNRHDTDFYRVSMATAFDLTPRAFSALRTPAAIAALSLPAGLALAWMLRRRGQHVAATLSVAATMTVFCYAANLAFQTFEPRLSSKPLAERLVGVLSPEDTFVVYGEFEQACSFSFYTGRSAAVYNGRYNGLAFGSSYPDSPPIFLDDAGFARLWSGPRRVFLFVPPEQRASATARLPAAGTHVAAESGGKIIFVNRAPVGN